MGYKMKGAPLHYGTKAHKSALKMKVDTEQYKGDTESSTANRNIREGKQEKQRSYVEGINEKLGGTKKEKRAQKRVMNKSEKIRKRADRQEEREKRTGKKEGKGVVGKIRKKVIDVTQKATTKKINKNLDKMTDKQAFNTARRYVPGKTYTKDGEVRSEKTGGKAKTDKVQTRDDGTIGPKIRERKVKVQDRIGLIRKKKKK